MTSHPPGYDEHFAALAAGHGPASWADPAEPDGTARRAANAAPTPRRSTRRREPFVAVPSEGARAERRWWPSRIVSLIASAGVGAA